MSETADINDPCWWFPGSEECRASKQAAIDEMKSDDFTGM